MAPRSEVAPPRAGLLLRWSRAALLAAVALGSGVIAHVSADGLLPGPTALLVLYVVTTAGCAALLGRPASALRLVVLTAGGQTFVHGALTALRGHRGDPPLAHSAPVPAPVATAPGRTGSYFDVAYAGAHPAAGGLAVPAPIQHLVADMSGPHALMAIAHLVAAAVVGLWLAVGERALWLVVGVLGERVSALLRRRSAGLSRPVAARPTPINRRRPIPRRTFLVHVVVRRGPPAYA